MLASRPKGRGSPDFIPTGRPPTRPRSLAAGASSNTVFPLLWTPPASRVVELAQRVHDQAGVRVGAIGAV